MPKTTQSKSKTKTRSKKSKLSQQKKVSPKQTAKKTTANLAQQANKLVQNKWVVIGSIVIILLAILYQLRGLLVAAMVNGRPISRLAILKEAEKTQGANLLQSMVTETLIQKEAQDQGVMIDEQEVQQEIDKIKQNVSEQGQDFEQLLTMQGMTLADLKDRIKTQKMVEALLGDQVEVTQEEVDQYLEENAEFLPEDKSEEELTEQARTQLEQQKLGQAYQEWLNGLKEKANIKYFVDYGQKADN